MKLDELKVSTTPKAEDEGEFENEDDKAIVDLFDGTVLLNKCMVMLGYLADPDFIKVISKKERDGMNKLTTKIKSYLDEVEGQYEE